MASARTRREERGRPVRRLFEAALVTVALAAAAGAAAAQHAAPPKATVATFAHGWVGHTSHFWITRNGEGREFINDGCCHHVIALSFRLVSQPRGTATRASVTFRVTAVRLFNKAIYWHKGRLRPHVGQLGRLLLRNDVLTETLTGAIYCGPRPPMRWSCGA
jgi:hypothetical protein